jgi:hypothetical protein
VAGQAADKEKVNLWLVIPCSIAGGALIGCAFITQTVWKWGGVATATMIDVGTVLLLAAVVFFLERGFTKKVADISARAARTAVENLQGEIQRQIAEEVRREDDLINAIQDDVSFSTVTEAMRVANLLRAIPGGSVVVQASLEPDGLRLLFCCIEYKDTRGPVLEIKPLVGEYMPRPGVDTKYQVTWQATQTAAEAFEMVRGRLREGRQTAAADRLALDVAINELYRTLSEATKLKRQGKLKGRLRELVGTDWAVTDPGIESLSHGIVIHGSEVPFHFFVGETEQLANWKPNRPDWIAEDQWERLIARAKEIFPKVWGLSPLSENSRRWKAWVDPASLTFSG